MSQPREPALTFHLFRPQVTEDQARYAKAHYEGLGVLLRDAMLEEATSVS